MVKKLLPFMLFCLFFGSATKLWAAEGCSYSSVTFTGCERLLISEGVFGFYQLLESFPENDLPSSKKAAAAGNFFRGASYFALYTIERSAAKKCEYAFRSMEDFKKFNHRLNKLLRESPDTVQDPQFTSWVLRQNIYNEELSKIKNCALEGYSASQLEALIRFEVEDQLKTMTGLKRGDSGENRTQLFQPLYLALGGIVNTTGGLLSALQSLKTELEFIAIEVDEQQDQRGKTADRIFRFSQDLQGVGGKPLPFLKKRNTGQERAINDLKLDELFRDRELFITINNRRAGEYLLNFENLYSYVNFLLNSNEELEDLKGNASSLVTDLVAKRDGLGEHKKEMAHIFRKRFPAACTNNPVKYWFCKTQN